MKKYKNQLSIGIVVVAAVFILLQYQNCGSSSGSNGSTVVGPSGLSYSVNITPTPTTVQTTGQQLNIQVTVQDSGQENLTIKIGYLTGSGARNPYCQYPYVSSSGQTITCTPTMNTAGTINLYVEVDDANLGQLEVLCENNSSPGCNGTYTVNVL